MKFFLNIFNENNKNNDFEYYGKKEAIKKNVKQLEIIDVSSFMV